jgi:hypothetical protein
VVRAAVLLGDAQGGQLGLEPVGATAKAVVKTIPLSVRVDCGVPWAAQAVRKVLTTIRPVTGACAVAEMMNREWSSSQIRISAARSSARDQWVKSACQHSLGRSAWNRIQARLGRLRGSGVMAPARVRMRQIVVTEGVLAVSRARSAAIECGPASAPSAIRAARSARTRSTVAWAVALGLDLGLLERGSSASQPPARHAATS